MFDLKLFILFGIDQKPNAKCNHSTPTPKTETKTSSDHAYTSPETVPGGEAGFEEVFGLVDLFTLGA